MSSPQRFYGKFRGQCLDNVDPMQVGRIVMSVPDVLGAAPSGWALPCVPVAGMQSGVFVLPPVGSYVWAEFEQGDPDRPIWVGGMYGIGDLPPLAAAAPAGASAIVLQTASGHAVRISDAAGPAGGILLQCASGASISVDDLGITISNARGAVIRLSGPNVDMNNGAMVV